MIKRNKLVLHDHDSGKANGAPSAFWDACFISSLTVALAGYNKNDVAIVMCQDIENEEDGVFHFIELDVKAASKGVLFSVGVLLKKDKDGEQKEIQISTKMYKHSTELDRLALEGVASLYGLKVVEVMEAYEVEALNSAIKQEQQESTVQ